MPAGAPDQVSGGEVPAPSQENSPGSAAPVPKAELFRENAAAFGVAKGPGEPGEKPASGAGAAAAGLATGNSLAVGVTIKAGGRGASVTPGGAEVGEEPATPPA